MLFESIPRPTNIASAFSWALIHPHFSCMFCLIFVLSGIFLPMCWFPGMCQFRAWGKKDEGWFRKAALSRPARKKKKKNQYLGCVLWKVAFSKPQWLMVSANDDLMLQVAGETETKGQIKLRFKTAAGKDVVCVRSFQLTQKASKMEYKALESILQTINPHTGEVTVIVAMSLTQIFRLWHSFVKNILDKRLKKWQVEDKQWRQE